MLLRFRYMPLSTGKLMCITCLHVLHSILHIPSIPKFCLFALHGCYTVYVHQRFSDNVLYGHSRIQGRIWVLKYHLHFLSVWKHIYINALIFCGFPFASTMIFPSSCTALRCEQNISSKNDTSCCRLIQTEQCTILLWFFHILTHRLIQSLSKLIWK